MQDHQQTPVSASERIRELNGIDDEVTSLLLTAGRAVKCLGRDAMPQEQAATSDSGQNQPPAESARLTFSAHNAEYLHLLQGIGARLRRQAYALEEAGILGTETEPNESQPTGGKLAAPGKEGTASGLGSLDISWLNSRRDDVQRIKEAELWKAARDFLEGTTEPHNDNETDDAR